MLKLVSLRLIDVYFHIRLLLACGIRRTLLWGGTLSPGHEVAPLPQDLGENPFPLHQ